MTAERPTMVRWNVMGILVLASFVSYTLRYNLSTAAPVMMADLGLSEIQWGWVLASFMLGYTLFQLPGGLLGDRFGPRRLLATIAVLWTLTTAITAAVPGAGWASTGVVLSLLMFARFITGVVHAPIYPGTNPAIVNWFPVGSWALPNGLSSTGLNLGVAATAPILAWSILEFGWRLSFLFMAPVGVLLAALWWWYARDNPADHKSVNAAEIELIRRGRSLKQCNADSGPRIRLPELLRNRDVVWLTLMYFCTNYTLYVVFSWFFYFLVEVRQFSMINAGFVTSAQWIGGGLGAALGGWFCDRLCKKVGLRWGNRLPLVVGCVISAMCLIGGLVAGSETIAIVLMVCCFFFNQFVDPPAWTASMAIGGRHSGAVGGVMNTGGNASGVLSAVLVPWLAQVAGWTVAIASAAAFSLLAAVLILLVRPDREMLQS